MHNLANSVFVAIFCRLKILYCNHNKLLGSLEKICRHLLKETKNVW